MACTDAQDMPMIGDLFLMQWIQSLCDSFILLSLFNLILMLPVPKYHIISNERTIVD
jgi:hypothetical protein